MSCGQCGTPRRGGRFCIGCGRRFAAQAAAARPACVTPRPRSPLADELTQPVLRLDRPSRPAVPAR